MDDIQMEDQTHQMFNIIRKVSSFLPEDAVEVTTPIDFTAAKQGQDISFGFDETAATGSKLSVKGP